MGVGGAVGVVWRHGDGGDGSCNGRAITGATATAVDGLPLNAAQRWMDGGRAHPTLMTLGNIMLKIVGDVHYDAALSSQVVAGL